MSDTVPLGSRRNAPPLFAAVTGGVETAEFGKVAWKMAQPDALAPLV